MTVNYTLDAGYIMWTQFKASGGYMLWGDKRLAHLEFTPQNIADHIWDLSDMLSLLINALPNDPTPNGSIKAFVQQIIDDLPDPCHILDLGIDPHEPRCCDDGMPLCWGCAGRKSYGLE